MHTRGAEPVAAERARPAADVECTCFGLDAREADQRRRELRPVATDEPS